MKDTRIAAGRNSARLAARMKVFGLRNHQIASLVLLCCSVCLGAQSLQAQSPWVPGDVFVGIGNGQYNVYHNNGDFVEMLTLPGSSGFTTGCSFDAASNLYTTDFSANNVVKFDANSHSPVTINTNGPTPPPPNDFANESIVFASNGDFFVGHADPDNKVQRYNSSGLWQQSFAVATEHRGSDWIELSSDQHTLFYTSEGRLIKSYDLSGNGAQLPDFATLPGTTDTNTAYALRLLPPGDGSGGLLVADTLDIKRLDKNGGIVKTYDIGGDSPENFWFALNLDPDGTSFWAGAFVTGNFYKFDIASGLKLAGPINVGTTPGLGGICVKGQPAAVNTVTHTVPPNTPTAFVFNANDPANSHAEKFTTPASGCGVSGTITMSVSATEVDGDGFCTIPSSADPNDSTDFDCRLVRFGTVNGQPACNGDPALGTATFCSLAPGTVVTVPHCIPYAHGRCVFYRVEPPQCQGKTVQEYITWNQPAPSAYTPACNGTVGNPRMFDDPSDPNDPYLPQDHQLIFDITNSFSASAAVGDPGTGGRTIGTNDWVIADRCIASAGSAAFLKPLNNSTSKLGSAIPVQVRLTSPSNTPITDASNKMTLEIADNNGILVSGFGTSGNSPGFWTYNSTSNFYSANLKTTTPPFSAGSYKMCVSSSISPPEFYPSCVTIALKK